MGLKRSSLVMIIFAVTIIALIGFSSHDAYATSFTAVANGRWDVPATWGGAVPISSDSVTIPSGITVTIRTVVTVDSGATITVNSGGKISVNSGGIINNGGTITNDGTVTNISGGIINNNSGIINNSGTIDNNVDGTINNNSGGTITNNKVGTITIFDGTINNNSGGTIENYGNIDDGGSINNSGTINNHCGGTITGNPLTGSPANGIPCTPTFTTSAGVLTGLTAVSESSLSPEPPAGDYPFGFFSWTITGLVPGASATMTINYPSDPGDVYEKLINGIWVTIPATVTPNSDGTFTVTLTVTDGGTGDADQIVNGQISDPGAMGTLNSTSIPEFPFSFNLVIIFVAVTAVYLGIRQKMTTNFKRF